MRSFGDAFFDFTKGELFMADYKEMYLKLFRAVTQATDILKEAQLECEEIYVNSSENDDNKIMQFKVLNGKNNNDKR